MGKIFQKEAGDKTKQARKKLAERVAELCAEQGVEANDNLSEADVRAFMQLTHAEKNVLNLIARGYPVRNSNAVLRAIELKLDRSAPRPVAQSGEGAAITVTVNSLGSEPVVTTTRDAIPAVKN